MSNTASALHITSFLHITSVRGAAHHTCPAVLHSRRAGVACGRGGCVSCIPGAGAVVRSRVGHLGRFDTAPDDGFCSECGAMAASVRWCGYVRVCAGRWESGGRSSVPRWMQRMRRGMTAAAAHPARAARPPTLKVTQAPPAGTIRRAPPAWVP